MTVRDPPPDPVAAFRRTWQRVQQTAPAGVDTAAATLATATREGCPSARVVLLRGVTPRGFQFFTNYESRKARELEETGRAALCFYWHWLDEQVRIEGRVERSPAAESDAYFASRPRGSQIGAWASRQSAPISSRTELEAACRDVERRFTGRDVPRPSFWGGYTLVPEAIEFWSAGEDRLHDRFRYSRTEHGWSIERLSP